MTIPGVVRRDPSSSSASSWRARLFFCRDGRCGWLRSVKEFSGDEYRQQSSSSPGGEEEEETEQEVKEKKVDVKGKEVKEKGKNEKKRSRRRGNLPQKTRSTLGVLFLGGSSTTSYWTSFSLRGRQVGRVVRLHAAREEGVDARAWAQSCEKYCVYLTSILDRKKKKAAAAGNPASLSATASLRMMATDIEGNRNN